MVYLTWLRDPCPVGPHFLFDEFSALTSAAYEKVVGALEKKLCHK